LEGETMPDHQPGTDRYTWAKAPRYGDKVVQTGPLAELHRRRRLIATCSPAKATTPGCASSPACAAPAG
jgi:Ni,Fe-hydrogenase I large subunit